MLGALVVSARSPVSTCPFPAPMDVVPALCRPLPATAVLVQLYAMVCETLRYKPLLDKLVLRADPK